MDFLKLLRAFLTNVYKMSDGDIDAILSASEATDETALAALLAKDKDRVTALLKPKSGQTFQDGYKKAKAEVLTAAEKELKEKYGIEDEDPANPLTGIELVAKIIEKEAPEAGKSALTEDAIKKHPIYLKLEREVKKQVTEVEKTWKQKYEDLEKGHKKAEAFGTVKSKALEILGELNPVLSENPKVAANQQKTWLAQFEGYEYETADDGTVTILKDGKRLEDGHGNPVDFNDFVKGAAEGYFDFKANNGGANPANKGKEGDDKNKGKKYPAGVVKPKKLEDLTALMNDAKLKVEDKTIIMEVWEQENPA